LHICERCGKEFEIGFDKNDRFCSEHCFYSHPFSNDQKEKLSKAISNSKRNIELRKKKEEHIKFLNETECVCEKCGKVFKGDYRSYKGSNPLKLSLPRFCSKSCASKRILSNETKMKISEKMKGEFKGAPLLWREKNPTEKMLHPVSSEKRYGRCTIENGGLIEKVCPVCGKSFTYYRHTPRKYCSRKCWDSVSGGYREGSVKNYTHGTYEGYYYDSSWELIWIKWALKNKVRFERNKVGFPYIYKGEEHKYYPDFYLPEKDEYVEIKGIDDDLWKAKELAFPKKLTVLKKKDIEALEKDLI